MQQVVDINSMTISTYYLTVYVSYSWLYNILNQYISRTLYPAQNTLTFNLRTDTTQV